jgi:hypothetical protein
MNGISARDFFKHETYLLSGIWAHIFAKLAQGWWWTKGVERKNQISYHVGVWEPNTLFSSPQRRPQRGPLQKPSSRRRRSPQAKMSTSGLKSIAPVPTAADFLDIVLSKTQRKTPTVLPPITLPKISLSDAENISRSSIRTSRSAAYETFT